MINKKLEKEINETKLEFKMNLKNNNIKELFWSLLGLIFITLKLCGVITWPWILVLAPFWIGVALLIAAFVIGMTTIGLITILS